METELSATVKQTSGVDLAKLTRTRTVRFWGQDYKVTPCLVPGQLGDGGQLIGLEPIMTRPDHYIVRVDSSWSFDDEDWPDKLERIYELIEEAFGSNLWTGYEDEGFPVLSSGGSSWWRIHPKES